MPAGGVGLLKGPCSACPDLAVTSSLIQAGPASTQQSACLLSPPDLALAVPPPGRSFLPLPGQLFTPSPRHGGPLPRPPS